MSEGLHVRKSGEEGSPVVLLHGLFGSGQNLGQLARGLSDVFVTYSLDLPDHGRSPWSESVSIEYYAELVSRWIRENLSQPVYLIGHSLGGKVAMAIAAADPSLVAKLAVLDIAAIDYPSRHDNVFAALRAVEGPDLKSRSEARTKMAEILEEPRVADFLLTNAVISEGNGLKWRFNLNSIESGYPNLLNAGSYPETYGGPFLLLRGEQSDYVSDDALEKTKRLFPLLDCITVSGAGHWLHQEQTDQVLTALRTFLVQ